MPKQPRTPEPRTVAVTGASGLIGKALVDYLEARGDTVVRFVRRLPAGPEERQWTPRPGGLDPATLADVDAVVHLAGAGVGDHRWTPAYKELILRSRVDSTRCVAAAIAERARTGHVVRLVNGSAIGVYGDRGDERLTEKSPPGTGFLADVVQAWENAADAAVTAGAPVAFSRTGLVMSADGGAFQRLLALARFGLAGPLGSGRQWWSWITLRDEIRALAHLVDRPEIVGPVNLVGPDPRPQRQVVAALASALGRPALVPAPAFALRVALGEFADDILASQRVEPRLLLDNGFGFEQATLGSAAATVV
ncbi:MAG: TIGR01777 family protein [Actinomycetales bacterium]|nr:MAG: TIGR01777 family protein [Actinomycetales bacterium]